MDGTVQGIRQWTASESHGVTTPWCGARVGMAGEARLPAGSYVIWCIAEDGRVSRPTPVALDWGEVAAPGALALDLEHGAVLEVSYAGSRPALRLQVLVGGAQVHLGWLLSGLTQRLVLPSGAVECALYDGFERLASRGVNAGAGEFQRVLVDLGR